MTLEEALALDKLRRRLRLDKDFNRRGIRHHEKEGSQADWHYTEYVRTYSLLCSIEHSVKPLLEAAKKIVRESKRGQENSNSDGQGPRA